MNPFFKNLSLLALAVIIGFTFQNTTEAQEWARSMFKVRSHDFGNVPKGKRPEFRFEIENRQP